MSDADDKPAKQRPGRKPSAPAVICSEGQRLLIGVGGTLAEVATAIGCNRTSVLDWRNGDKTPLPEMRARLFAAYEIPIASWDLVPTTQEAPAVATASGATPTTLADCLGILAMLRESRTRGPLRPADAVRLASAETRILAF